MRTDDIAEELGVVFSSHRVASFCLLRELNEREPTVQSDCYIHDIQIYDIQCICCGEKTSKIREQLGNHTRLVDIINKTKM